MKGVTDYMQDQFNEKVMNLGALIKKNYDQLAHSSTIPHIKEDESVFRSKSELNSVKSRQKKQRKSVSK